MKLRTWLGPAWVVLRKEVIDNLRDRRSLLSGLLMPLLGPVMFAVLFTTLASDLRTDKPLRLPVRGAEHAPSLIEYLKTQDVEIVGAPADLETQIRQGKIDAALAIPKEYGTEFSQGRMARVELLMDSSRSSARGSLRRLEGLLARYSSSLGALRLLARGIDPQLASPLDVQAIDLATPERTAAHLLSMIPLFLLLSVFMGGMYAAIDSTAGERERGSLEPLLITPVLRGQVILGKWMAAVLVSWLAVACALAGFAVALRLVPLQDLGLRAQLGLPELLIISSLLLPLSLLSAGLQLLLALFSRTFKEAQTWLSLMMLLPAMPATFLSLSPVVPKLWMMAVPALSQTLLLTDTLRGDSASLAFHGLAALSSVVWAGLTLLGATWLLGQEKIVFGRGAGTS